jgi:hypothetical protein
VLPIAVHHVRGARLDDGTVMLERRTIGLKDNESSDRDLVVKIEVDGVQRCFCIAKATHTKLRISFEPEKPGLEAPR